VAERSSASRPAATGGRLSVFFAVRYLLPAFALVALAASQQTSLDRQRLAALLTAQVAFTVATHALALRRPSATATALWVGIVADLAVITALASGTGGAGGPLTYLYTIEALAAGILLSSGVGVRVLALSTAAIIGLDLATSVGDPNVTPRGLEAIAVLWAVAGAATLFSVFNERELRRRTAELATIRRVTLDIEDSLSLQDILADLCRGVVEAFRFSSAAVLLRRGDALAYAGGYNVTGAASEPIEPRGGLRRALDGGRPVVVPGDEARRDGVLSAIMGARGYVAVPLGAEGLLVVTRAGRGSRPAVLRAREIETLSSLAHHATFAIANARLHAQVSATAITDPLTGLANHGEFQRVLAQEIGRLERFSTLRAPGHHTSLILADVDHFKAFNDSFGHQAGDAALRAVADAIQSAVRSFDVAARYGGEELAVVLPETDEEGAYGVAERIREAVRRSERGLPRRVTISVGVATAPDDGTSAAELITAADQALYRSKETGRDRTTGASELRRRLRKVVALRPSAGGRGIPGAPRVSRRRPEPAGRRAGAGARRAPARSSRPRRRTPRA
jgi:diguanylate cyclase (GGDEF)-like protein